MITSQPTGRQTGLYSRITNPYASSTPEALQARLLAAKRPTPPTRNVLAGASGTTGIFARLKAWLRGEI